MRAPWLAAKLRRAVALTPKGHTIMDFSPAQFRRLWANARKKLQLPATYTPYGLRRGGATSLYQSIGSFDVVADRGRWASVAALRIYVTTALQELSLYE